MLPILTHLVVVHGGVPVQLFVVCVCGGRGGQECGAASWVRVGFSWRATPWPVLGGGGDGECWGKGGMWVRVDRLVLPGGVERSVFRNCTSQLNGASQRFDNAQPRASLATTLPDFTQPRALLALVLRW